MIERELTVICVHGEGSREVLHKRIADGLVNERRDPREADAVQPNVLAVLRDGEHRVELPLTSWEDVEAFRQLPGVWDENANTWTMEKARVKIAIG